MKRAIVRSLVAAVRGARTAWLVVAIAVAVALVSMVTLDLGPAVKRRAELEGSKFIDRPLHIGRLGLNLGRGRLVLEDVRVDGLTPAHDPWLVAGRVELSITWRTLLERRVFIDNVDLSDWTLIIESYAGAVTQHAAPDRAATTAAHRTAGGHHHAAVPQRHARPVAGPRLRLVVGDGRPQPRSRDLEGRRLPRHAALLGRDPPHPAVRADLGQLHRRLHREGRQDRDGQDGPRRRRHAGAGHRHHRRREIPRVHLPDHLAPSAAARAGDLLRQGQFQPARRRRLHRHRPQVQRRLRGEGGLCQPRGRLRRLPLPELQGVGAVGAEPLRRRGRRSGVLRRAGQLHLSARAAGRPGPAGRRALGRVVPRCRPERVHRLPRDARAAAGRPGQRPQHADLDAGPAGRGRGRGIADGGDAARGRPGDAHAARRRGGRGPPARRADRALQSPQRAGAGAGGRADRLQLRRRRDPLRAEHLRDRRDVRRLRRPHRLGRRLAAALPHDQQQLAGEPPPADRHHDHGGVADRVDSGGRRRVVRRRDPRRAVESAGRGPLRRRGDAGLERHLGRDRRSRR